MISKRLCRSGGDQNLRLLLAVALTGTACAHAPSGPAPFPERFVLLHAATTLFTHPDEHAEQVNPYRDPGAAMTNFEAVAWRLVEERDGWMELEPVPPRDERHCFRGMWALEGMRVRLFARATAKLPLLSRSITQRWEDGTWLKLASGVALFPNPSGGFRTKLDGVLLAVVPQPEAVGKEYLPGTRFARFDRKRLLTVEALRQGEVRYGGTTALASTGSLVFPLRASDEAPQGEGALVTVGGECFELRARVPVKALVDEKGVLGALWGAASSSTTQARLGASLYWRDGAPAGVATGELDLGVEGSGIPGKRCFAKALRFIGPEEHDAPPANTLHLCVAPEDVVAATSGK